MPEQHLEKPLRVQQVADLLGVSESKVWKYCRSDGLPAVRLGRRTTRFMPSSIQMWLEAHEQASDAEAKNDD